MFKMNIFVDFLKSIKDKKNSIENIKHFKIPEGIEIITRDIFAGIDINKIETIIIPNSAKNIAAYAFGEFENLKSIEIPDSIIKIDECAFIKCTNLKSIKLSANLKIIASSAFAHCTSLKSIEIPNSVEKIGWWIFDDCTSLESITIPEKLENWLGNFAIDKSKVNIDFVK